MEEEYDLIILDIQTLNYKFSKFGQYIYDNGGWIEYQKKKKPRNIRKKIQHATLHKNRTDIVKNYVYLVGEFFFYFYRISLSVLYQ